jgi:glycosyltransferase involved in cell wall biosynthesis
MSNVRELVVDSRCLGTGIGAYSLNLLAGIKSRGTEFRVRAITTKDQRSKVAPYCDEVSVVNAPVYSFREQVLVPKAAAGATVLHALHYNAPLLHRGPMLVTIYDLTHILDKIFRRTLKSWLYAQPMLRLAAMKAAHIFTISIYSRDCICEILGVDSANITVAYPGVGPQFHPLHRPECRYRVSGRLGTAAPYLLFVGNLKPHKNVEGLLRTFARLREARQIDHRLIVVGNDPKRASLVRAYCDRLGLGRDVSFIPYVSQEELIDLYNAADVVVLPSFEEGFGLPVLEALACGTPVACSRTASLPEAGGDLAEYFQPDEDEDMAAAILRALTPAAQDRVRTLGPAWGATFSWSRCTDAVCKIYSRYL